MDMDTALSQHRRAKAVCGASHSGSHAASICDRLFVPSSSRFAKPSAMVGYTLAHGYWGKIDEVVLACFRAPHSYTGEDVYEISCHGGQAIRQAVLDSVLAAGARPAGPGEFSRRAFFNGKMDLTAAEAVMDMIGAQAEKQAQAAYRQLTGGVSRVIHERTDHLYGALARLEMLLDWDEEEERPEDRELLVRELEYAERVTALGRQFCRWAYHSRGARSRNRRQSQRRQINASQRPIRVTARSSAISQATRDTVEVDLTLDGYLVHLTGTAGLAIDSDDPIEREGIVRAENALRTADLILWVLSPPLPPEDERREEEARIDRCLAEGKEILFVLGKDDLRLTLSAEKDPAHYAAERYPDLPSMTWSDRSEDDLQRLKETLVRFIESGSLMSPVERAEIAAHDQVKSHSEGQSHGLLTHARHKAAVDRAVELVKNARADLQAGLSFDLVAISLKEALTELSTITGEDVSETLIDKIFSRFCIGK